MADENLLQSWKEIAAHLGRSERTCRRWDLVPPGARVALYYLMAGSKNQDPRGAVLDGETTYLVAGPWSLYDYPTFLVLMINTTWIERQEQLDALISVEEEGARKLGRFIRKVL